MDPLPRLPRSPELMSSCDTALLVVDVQERLVPAIAGHERVVWNVRRLIDGAKVLGLPVVATEQYPKGLGPTVPELAQRLGEVPSKLTFSCGGCPAIFEQLRARGIHKLLVCGIEAHVCVQQTVLDLLADGWRVYVAADAIGSRFEGDLRTAQARMDSSGATLTTTEAALFEWCDAAGTPEFKQISRLAREEGPRETEGDRSQEPGDRKGDVMLAGHAPPRAASDS
jgi:nicotinamidase-related amidase